MVIAVLILVPTLVLFLVSYFVQPVLPPPWNSVLILLGVVVAAVFGGLLRDTKAKRNMDQGIGDAANKSTLWLH